MTKSNMYFTDRVLDKESELELVLSNHLISNLIREIAAYIDNQTLYDVMSMTVWSGFPLKFPPWLYVPVVLQLNIKLNNYINNKININPNKIKIKI